MSRFRIALAAVLALLFSLSSAAAFDSALLGQTDRVLQQNRADLDSITALLRRPALSPKDLADARASLDVLQTTAALQSAALAAPLAEVSQQITSLGPAPQGAAEDARVAQARSDLNTARDKLLSLKSQFDVIAVEAEQTAGRVSVAQRDQFFERIFDRKSSIFSLSVWYDTTVGLGVLLSGLALLFRNWWAQVGPTGDPIGLLLVPVFVIIFAGGYWFINRWAKRWMERYSNRSRNIDDIARLWRIVRGLITTLVALFILFLPIRLSLDAGGYFTPRLLMVWDALVTVIGGTTLYYVLARRVAAASSPEWRIVDLDDDAASRFTILGGITALVAFVNTQAAVIADGLFLPVNYAIGQSALAALVLLVLFSITLLVVKNQDGLANPGGRKLLFKWAAKLTPFLWVIILVGFGALATGYLALANYLSHQLVRTAMVVGLLIILYHLLDAAVTSSFDPQSGFGVFLRRVTGLGERGIERLGLMFRTAVDLVLVMTGIPALVLLWTLTWVDFRGFFNTLALGVQIGNVTISPGILLVMLAILAGGIVATKLFSRWLDRRILNDTRINRGVQDSILKGSTYLGYMLAAGFALTATGIDFSNLALIAGALGLGIGLGLQSIVNNFVSGLIILAERPIRVGDWVAVPAGEGIVRRINVRSTEIETFDACSIILPNSMLVAEAVRNWTHNDNMGRFTIPVSVDYGSDAERVRKLLLQAAHENTHVLTSPAPNVTLARFGVNGLDFELRAHVGDVFEASAVASDIRFRLLTLFNEKGIIIAQPVAVLQPPKA